VTPRVSVIVNCHNGEGYLREALDSVYEQSFDDWEVVFWDNLSSDATPKIAQGYDRRVRYHRGETFVPLGQARNLAVARARGELVAFLDADDSWEPRKLAAQVAILDRDPHAVMAYTDTQVMDADGRPLALYSHRFHPAKGDVLADMFLNNFVAFSSCIVRRQAFDAVGGFAAHLQIAEDFDFLLKLAERGPFAYLEEPLTRYRVHRDNWSWNVRLGRAEAVEVLHATLERHPELRERLGPHVIRFRLAGLAVEPAERLLLQGNLTGAADALGETRRMARFLPRTLALYGLAAAGPGATAAVLTLWSSRVQRR
jgi:glycosyltransferase involved in cell wall biosynthesis